MTEEVFETATALKVEITSDLTESETDSGVNMDSSCGVLGVDQYGSDEEVAAEEEKEGGGNLEEEQHEEEQKENPKEEQVKQEIEQDVDQDVELDDNDIDVQEEDIEEHVEEESKIRIVEGGLNFILKNFDGIGDFYGLIISYDQPYFRVCTFPMSCMQFWCPVTSFLFTLPR